MVAGAEVPHKVTTGVRPKAQLKACDPALADLIRKCWHQQGPRRPAFAEVVAEVERMLNDAATCPRELLLFFHHLNWDHPMSWGGGKVGNGTVSLFEFIRQTHRAAVQEVGEMARDWDSLEGMVDEGRFKAVQARFLQQANDARVFSDVVTGYYANVSRRGRAGRRRET